MTRGGIRPEAAGGGLNFLSSRFQTQCVRVYVYTEVIPNSSCAGEKTASVSLIFEPGEVCINAAEFNWKLYTSLLLQIRFTFCNVVIPMYILPAETEKYYTSAEAKKLFLPDRCNRPEIISLNF